METVITKSMELVFVIPGQVFTWIGGSMSSNVGMGADSQVGQGANQGMSSLQGAMQQGGSQIANGMRKPTTTPAPTSPPTTPTPTMPPS